MKRKQAQYNLLQSQKFFDAAAHISEILSQHSWVLIGGLATAHYANPPVTVDVDILFDNHDWPESEVVDGMSGWKSHPLWFMTGLRGFPRSGYKFSKRGLADVDVLFTGKDKFLRSVVRHRQIMKIGGGVEIPVIKAEDLIIMKTLAGREKDEDDVEAMWSEMGDKLDASYISRTIEKLG